MQTLVRLSVLSLFLFVSCTSSESLEDVIQTMGRVIKSPGNTWRMVTSASQIEFQFAGDTCSVWLSTPVAPQQHQYAVLEVDSVYAGRIRVDNAMPVRFQVPVSKTRAWHTVRIVKATEASNGVLDFHRATAAQFRRASVNRDLRIEFIGNSITAAMGSDTTVLPCGRGSTWYDQHNGWYSYAAIAGRELGADFMLTAVSGAGIYRNWNSDGPTVPELYPSAWLHPDSTRQWDFQTWQPHLVTIALGTNDMSPGDGKKVREPFDSARFVSRYTEFVASITQVYPQAQIVLLTSPLKSGKQAKTLMGCLQAVRASCIESKVSARPPMILEFREMKATGCTGHPLIPEQQEMARQVVTFVRAVRSDLQM